MNRLLMVFKIQKIEKLEDSYLAQLVFFVNIFKLMFILHSKVEN